MAERTKSEEDAKNMAAGTRRAGMKGEGRSVFEGARRQGGGSIYRESVHCVIARVTAYQMRSENFRWDGRDQKSETRSRLVQKPMDTGNRRFSPLSRTRKYDCPDLDARRERTMSCHARASSRDLNPCRHSLLQLSLPSCWYRKQVRADKYFLFFFFLVDSTSFTQVRPLGKLRASLLRFPFSYSDTTIMRMFVHTDQNSPSNLNSSRSIH